METGNVTFFGTQAELHDWFGKFHDNLQELWIGFHKKNSKRKTVTYSEALDEALCFGWIDGIRKTYDENSYTIRFTPRRAGSNWSKVNIAKAEELIASNQMHSSGLKVFNERKNKSAGRYSYEERSRELDKDFIKKFSMNKKAWDFFQAQAPYYKRVVSWWVMSAKREETRLKRLTVLIDSSEKGQKIPAMQRPGENNQERK